MALSVALLARRIGTPLPTAVEPWKRGQVHFSGVLFDGRVSYGRKMDQSPFPGVHTSKRVQSSSAKAAIGKDDSYERLLFIYPRRACSGVGTTNVGNETIVTIE